MGERLRRTAALKRAVRRLVRAEIAESWWNSRPPEEWPHIELELIRARAGYHVALKRLEEAL